MLGRSVSLNVVGQAASLAIGFVSSIAVARWLGPADRGLLAIMIQISSIAVALAGIGLTYAVLYFASQKDADRGAILGNGLLHGGLLALVFVPAAWLAREPLARHLGQGHGGATWLLCGAFVSVLFLDWSTHNQVFAYLRFGFMNVLRVVSKLAYLLAVVFLVGTLHLGLTGAMLATIGMSAVMVAGSLWVVVPHARVRLDRALFRRMAGYGLRVQIGTVFEIVNYRLDVLVLQFFRPLATVGYYVVAQLVSELVLTLGYAFQTSVNPLVTHYEGETGQEETSTVAMRHHTLLAGVAVLANAGFGTAVILLGYGHRFQAALVPMLILLPGMLFLGTASVVAGDLRGRGRPGASSTLAGCAMVLTVVLDLALIPPLGIDGAALASLLTYTAYGIAAAAVLARVTGVPLRRLVVPTRADLAVYPARLRGLRARLRASG